LGDGADRRLKEKGDEVSEGQEQEHVDHVEEGGGGWRRASATLLKHTASVTRCAGADSLRAARDDHGRETLVLLKPVLDVVPACQ
jgi:hypothetical protein